MRFPARINPGILSKTKTSIPEYILAGMISSGIPLNKTYTRHENPSANAMGNLNTRQIMKIITSRAII
jgi:hypothetical protein